MIWKARTICSSHQIPRRVLKWCSGFGSFVALAVGTVYVTADTVPEEPGQYLQARTAAGSSNGSPSERAPDDLASKLARREVQRSNSSIPGHEIVQVITQIPPGVESGWHVHPGEEVGYVIAGSIEMKVQGRDTVVLGTGDGFLIPPRTAHNARDLGPETGHMLSTYIVEAGRQLSTFVDQPDQP